MVAMALINTVNPARGRSPEPVTSLKQVGAKNSLKITRSEERS